MENKNRAIPKNVLVVSPHPDDETLGCGGTILKHRAEGDTVSWLIMTRMTKAGGYSKEAIAGRQREIASVAKAYTFHRIYRLDIPTTRLDIAPKGDMVRAVHDILLHIKPDILYVPYRGDIHSDHCVTFGVIMSAAKTFRSPSIAKVLMYETISDTEFSPPLRDTVFLPNSYSDITGYLDRKVDIMRLYGTEMKKHPFPRNAKNIKALATFRGAVAGKKYAEAFMVLKEIW